MSGRPVVATSSEDARAAAEARYLQDAIDLNNCVALNANDDDFVRLGKGRVRYVFDANILRFYLNPFKRDERRRVALFMEGADEEEEDDARALAAVTAEFLLSGGLCGQWHQRPMISRWHAEELEAHSRNMGEVWRLRLPLGGATPGEIEGDAFEEFVRKIAERAASIQGLRVSIKRMESPLAGIGEVMEDEIFEARQFGLMMRERLIRSLHLDPLAARLAWRPDEEEVAKLARRKASLGSATDREPDRRDFADARTLTMVAALNRESAKADPSDPVRYLLVTTDNALYNLALDEFGGRSRRDQPDWMPVRRIAQFVPYLNTAQIDNRVDSGELMQEIRAALSDFLIVNSMFGSGPGPRPLPLSERGRGREVSEADGAFAELSVFRDHQLEMRASPAYNDKLGKLSRLWRQLGRESVLLNSALIGRRVDRFLSLSAVLEEAEDVRDALHGVMLETVRELERGHLVLGVEHYLSAELAEIAGKGGGLRQRRGVLALRRPFPDVIGADRPLAELERLLADPGATDPQELLARVGAAGPEQAYLFCGCLAFWASKWDEAVHFAGRALEQVSAVAGGDEIDELALLERRYFQLAARRFQAMSVEATPAERQRLLVDLHSDAEDLWILAVSSEDPFEICRAEVEYASLELSLVFIEGIARREPPGEWADALADGAYHRLSAAARGLAEARGRCGEEAYVYLLVELSVALSGYLTYRVMVSRRDHAPLMRDSRGLTDRISAILATRAVALPAVYDGASDFVEQLQAVSENRDQAMAELKEKLRAIRDQGPAFTRMDLEAMNFLIDLPAAGPAPGATRVH